MRERVVITALGCCTPLGNTYDSVTAALRDGTTGIREIQKFDTASFKSHFAGVPEVGNMRTSSLKRSRSWDELYINNAVKGLMAWPGMDLSHFSPQRIGCFLGVDEPVPDIHQTVDFVYDLQRDADKAFTNMAEVMEKHYRISDFARLDSTQVLRQVHAQIPFHGPSMVHLGLCAASLQAIGTGFEQVARGRVDAAIVGGASAKVTPEHYIGLESVDVICTDASLPFDGLSRPFDTRRSGYVPAEGAVLFLLESYTHALRRGAVPLMEIVGYGASMNASHIVKPDPESREMKLSMTRALASAGLNPSQIGLVNAHGTSTVLNDLHESAAICSVLSERVPVTANKSLHGHMIAAAGAMETLNTLIGLREGFIPGTRNLETPDPQCKANIIGQTQSAHIEYCLKNSFGMGGLAASMIFRRIDA
ncbi:beta-ketoacyl-[acyl-carrier-protein] synthase family protein [Pseudomonas palleroniana]|uniref:Nodulation protein E n=1 Tax=Pseudomonas palleroniana TaxID=191390 RepID=A0A1H5N8L7_9PSED|nr:MULTISPECIES: beta-ketoacyl-[acyl-carrier-protein] synthase family protein [Pseudomonas]KAB0569720.1 beta-ketoacyl-[acyl-carrier-protein] synthase family protein [Pseudomonas palleroniana]MBM9484748.1 beta-ketoacyl-[acyl-carrier-protein] synthase family protein [Pseudomonas sp. ICBG1301]PTC31242.1 beta-ketoacyl-[acyl-carrier-protein] synthase family protein [Pseudomonas palleroniana]SEE97207.1 3-oxoacyl-[acyl-carrier-protein] synthase II [Pseudomonas palleroniana]